MIFKCRKTCHNFSIHSKCRHPIGDTFDGIWEEALDESPQIFECCPVSRWEFFQILIDFVHDYLFLKTKKYKTLFLLYKIEYDVTIF